jgi:D-arabinose 1-dehydrogenase-like Zn-dependent alcohol dehydrogenase
VLVGGSLAQIFQTMILGPLFSLGGRKMRLLSAKSNRKDLEWMIRLVEEGKLKPIIDRYYPLEQTAEAMRYFSQGHVRGLFCQIARTNATFRRPPIVGVVH